MKDLLTKSVLLVAALTAAADAAAGEGDQLKPNQVKQPTKRRTMVQPPVEPVYTLTLQFAASAERKGWHCADLPGGESSLWYRPEVGWTSVARQGKPCDAPKLFEVAPQVNEVDLKPYRAVTGWDDWLCADFKDGRHWSAWHHRTQPSTSATAYSGTCDSWSNGEKRGP